MPGVFTKSVGWILTVTKTVSKIANLGKRGVLFVWKDELGLRAVGSPAMLERFNRSRACSDCGGGVHASWEEAANKDSINLATGNAVVNIDSKSSNAELIKQITEGLSTAKLPCRLEFIATSEAIKWLEPELKKDFIEQGKKPVKKIPWGSNEYIPKCWAGDVWKWETMNNPRHKQVNPPENGVRLIDVLQATIKNRLSEKGIDPAMHISEFYTEAMDDKKRLARGIKIKPAISAPAVSETMQIEEQCLSEVLDSDCVPMNAEITDVEDEVFENNDTHGDHNNSISSDEGSFYEKDEDGRRKLPSRQAGGTLFEDHSLDPSAHHSPPPPPNDCYPAQSPPPAQSSPQAGCSSPAPVARSLRSGAAGWTKGRGKGGKRMGIRGGLVSKDCLPPRGKAIIDAKRNRRNDWQEWVKNYKMQTENLIKKARKTELKCPECEENISKSSFLKHRTERGCINLDPKLKMGNWTIENYL